MKEKTMNEIRIAVDNIEQLSADMRYLEYDGALRIKANSVIFWAKKIIKELNKNELHRED